MRPKRVANSSRPDIAFSPERTFASDDASAKSVSHMQLTTPLPFAFPSTPQRPNVQVVRWGIIGCGDVTEVKSGPGFYQAERSRLVAVMRRNRELAADYARRHNVPRWYDRAEQLIADPEVDAVYIATPPDSHLYYALQVAAAGKPA